MELTAAWEAFAPGSALPHGAAVESLGQVGRVEAAGKDIWFSVSGAGSPWTQSRMHLGLAGIRPSAVLQVGLAGAYDGSGLNIGDSVLGTSECFGDIGVEWPSETDPNKAIFRPLGDMAWAHPLQKESLVLTPWPALIREGMPELKTGAGVTVNCVTGSESMAAFRRELWRGDFETMEGAGCALACHAASVPCLQLRTISNRVGARDMRPDDFRSALHSLTRTLSRMERLWR